MAVSHTFYLRLGDKVSGPVTTQQLREMVANGTLRKTDYVRASDQEKWYVAGRVKGLFANRLQSSRATLPHTPSPHDDSGRPLTSPTEGMIDIEAFERYRKRRLAARRKRLLLWGGATAGIVIISLVVVSPLIRSAGVPENATEDRSRSNAVRSPAPEERESSPKLSASDPAPKTVKPTGLGWSLADIEREWGESRNWYWLLKDEKDGCINYMAANRTLPRIKYMVLGPPHNVTSLTLLIAIHENDSDADVLVSLSAPCVMLSRISAWDSETIGTWIGERWAKGEWPTEGHKLQRGYEELWMNAMGTTEGVMLMVGVQIAEEPAWSDWSPSTAEPAPAFVYANVSSRHEEYGGFRIIGEITNNSGRNLQIASFTLSVYDSNGRLVDTAPIVISNFATGRTKSFDANVETLPESWEFKIDFENGIE